MKGSSKDDPFFMRRPFDNRPDSFARVPPQSLMASAPSLQSLVDDALVLLPTLARRIVDETLGELRRRPQYHHLFEAWQRQSARLTLALETTLSPMLQAAAQGRDPLHPGTSKGTQALSLVDETQALRDVAIAHAAKAIEDQSRAELHQLGNFFAALRGIARPRKNENPLRAELFAHGFYDVLQAMPLDPQTAYSLVQVAAAPLAQSMQLLYANLCEQLRQAELSQLVSSHAASHAEDLQQLRRAKSSDDLGVFMITQSATLDGLSRRVDALNSRPQALNSEPAPLLGPATLAPGKDLLSRLYDQILLDPHLPAPVKARLARLQVAVSRLAMVDLSLMRRQDHPAWLLLNRVAAHGMGFERGDDGHLQAFLSFLDEQIEQLVSQPQPSAALFQQAQSAVRDFIAQQALQRSAPNTQALAVLEREQMRNSWRALVKEQISAQLAEAAGTAEISKVLHAFLRSVWVDVIVDAMVQQGRESSAAQTHIELVDALLTSLQPPASNAERERLRRMLPGLVQQLERGMDAVNLAQDKRRLLLDDLMQAHGRLLLGPATPTPAPERMAAAPRELSPEEQTRRMLAERESLLPSGFFQTRIDRAVLPTVPLPLQAETQREAVETWMEQLQLGTWYHMFVQSEWITAQITWISENSQIFHFVGQDSAQQHTLTRGAIEQLLANGLIAHIDEQSLVQRAIEQLMHTLDDAP